MKRERLKPEDLSLPQQRYVEAITDLSTGVRGARITDVADRLGVRLPSASEAVKRLVRLGLVARVSRFEIRLAGTGEKIGRQLARRHRALRTFMTDVMAMPAGVSDRTACRVEHCVGSHFTDRLVEIAGLLKRDYPRALEGIVENMKRRRKPNRRRQGAAPSRGESCKGNGQP